MSQSSSVMQDRYERHLMRQRGAGPRNVTATFGFSFDFPSSGTSDPAPVEEPPAKRRKTESARTPEAQSPSIEHSVLAEAEPILVSLAKLPVVNDVESMPVPAASAKKAPRTKQELMADTDTDQGTVMGHFVDAGDGSFAATAKPKRARAKRRDIDVENGGEVKQAVESTKPSAKSRKRKAVTTDVELAVAAPPRRTRRAQTNSANEEAAARVAAPIPEMAPEPSPADPREEDACTEGLHEHSEPAPANDVLASGITTHAGLPASSTKRKARATKRAAAPKITATQSRTKAKRSNMQPAVANAIAEPADDDQVVERGSTARDSGLSLGLPNDLDDAGHSTPAKPKRPSRKGMRAVAYSDDLAEHMVLATEASQAAASLVEDGLPAAAKRTRARSTKQPTLAKAHRATANSRRAKGQLVTTDPEAKNAEAETEIAPKVLSFNQEVAIDAKAPRATAKSRRAKGQPAAVDTAANSASPTHEAKHEGPSSDHEVPVNARPSRITAKNRHAKAHPTAANMEAQTAVSHPADHETLGEAKAPRATARTRKAKVQPAMVDTVASEATSAPEIEPEVLASDHAATFEAKENVQELPRPATGKSKKPGRSRTVKTSKTGDTETAGRELSARQASGDMNEYGASPAAPKHDSAVTESPHRQPLRETDRNVVRQSASPAKAKSSHVDSPKPKQRGGQRKKADVIKLQRTAERVEGSRSCNEAALPATAAQSTRRRTGKASRAADESREGVEVAKGGPAIEPEMLNETLRDNAAVSGGVLADSLLLESDDLARTPTTMAPARANRQPTKPVDDKPSTQLDGTETTSSANVEEDIDWLFAPQQREQPRAGSAKTVSKAQKPRKAARRLPDIDLDDLFTDIAAFAPVRKNATMVAVGDAKKKKG